MLITVSYLLYHCKHVQHRIAKFNAFLKQWIKNAFEDSDSIWADMSFLKPHVFLAPL